MDLQAKEIMNPNVITVTEEMTRQELAQLFTEHLISGAPVVDEEGKLTGVVSLADIARSAPYRRNLVKKNESSFYMHGWEEVLSEDELSAFHIEEVEGVKVRDIMTPLLIRVTEETPMSEMADIMIDGRVHRLIVTRKDRVVGIVTTLDMLKAIKENGPG